MIRASEVRLVAEDGEQLGIQVLKDALEIAAEAGLDLVEVAPTAKPPVCRMMDYGKYKYLMSKKASEAKKKQTVIHVKEIKLRSKTEEHDLKFKLKNIIKFLTAGDKVKVTMVFRGREITHTDLGLERLKRIMEDVKEVGTVEQTPKLEGRSMTMVIAPMAQKKE